MKNLLIIALITISGATFAQDGYHEYEVDTCQREACLVSGDVEIGFVEKYDREFEETYFELNTSSALSDVVYKGAELCYTGSVAEVSNILEDLGEIENSYYPVGGHTEIIDVITTENDGSINVKYQFRDDYTATEQEFSTVISTCSNI